MIQRKLGQLEQTLRFYAFVNGITVLLFTAAGLFWFDLAFDRFFELPLIVRAFTAAALSACLAAAAYRYLIRTCLMTFGNEMLAAVFERFVPALNGTLLTVVSRNFPAAGISVTETLPSGFGTLIIQDAAEKLRGVNVRRFFCVRRLTLLLFCAFVCSASIPLFFVLCSETAAVWLSRSIFLSQQNYPRRSLLIADGFQDGIVRIGKGDNFTLSVRADMSMPLVPEKIRIRTANRTLTLEHFTVQTTDGTDYRVFTHTFPEVLEPMTLHIRGADTTLDNLHIGVLPVPVLTDFSLQLSYPDYMQRQPQTVPVIGRTMIPDGTAVTVAAAANKPLLQWTAQWTTPNGLETVKSRETAAFTAVECPLPVFRSDVLLDFRLNDIDSLHNRQPIHVDLAAVKDKPPVVTARLDGIGVAVTPDADVPMSGEMSDDYGICRAALTVNKETKMQWTRESGQWKSAANVQPGTDIARLVAAQSAPFNFTYSLSTLQLKPGSSITLFLSAADKCNLDGKTGQSGEGPHWTLEVVTPERLKTLLEVRETTLRQRFEVVIGEVGRTKTFLNQPIDDFNKSRMLRDTQKEVYDQRSILDAFELIRQEMLNNKIFTDDLQQRLNSGIISPLRNILSADFPELDKRIESLQPETAAAKTACLEQFDTVVKRMQDVRDNMLSLESFNEAVELLRSILKQQQQIRSETLEEKNNRLKKLLED
ncbi:MAG: hypothetical protein LBT89_09965 [Planctomycetaceae bacterium]|jgi:hypothetical protein|nr:hypothetical protein [Planctomycetaceae bacterium]